MRAVLTGKYRHSVDAKNRIIIPAKLKEQLLAEGGFGAGESVMVLKSPADPCLTLYSMEEWRLYAEKISALPRTKMRDLVRYLYSNSLETEPDSQGRIMLPQEMLDYAGIKRDLVTVGCGRYAEIWSAEVWAECNKDAPPENLAAMLEELDL